MSPAKKSTDTESHFGHNIAVTCMHACMHALHARARTHTHTHNMSHIHFTALWILPGTTRVSQYDKKHSPTHTYGGHQSSLICFLHLLRSMASSLFNLHTWESFSTISLQVFFGLPLGPAPSASYSMHFLLWWGYKKYPYVWRPKSPYTRSSSVVTEDCTMLGIVILRKMAKCSLHSKNHNDLFGSSYALPSQHDRQTNTQNWRGTHLIKGTPIKQSLKHCRSWCQSPVY